MDWIVKYSELVSPVVAWQANAVGGRDLIHYEARTWLEKTKDLMDTAGIKDALSPKAYADMVNDFRRVSRWYIAFMEASKNA